MYSLFYIVLFPFMPIQGSYKRDPPPNKSCSSKWWHGLHVHNHSRLYSVYLHAWVCCLIFSFRHWLEHSSVWMAGIWYNILLSLNEPGISVYQSFVLVLSSLVRTSAVLCNLSFMNYAVCKLPPLMFMSDISHFPIFYSPLLVYSSHYVTVPSSRQLPALFCYLYASFYLLILHFSMWLPDICVHFHDYLVAISEFPLKSKGSFRQGLLNPISKAISVKFSSSI